MTHQEAQAKMREWEIAYTGTKRSGGFMILSLCVLLVGIGIELLNRTERLTKE